MHRIAKKPFMILTCVSLAALAGFMVSAYSESGGESAKPVRSEMPIAIAHMGSADTLERPPAVFDHLLHTSVLGRKKSEDCAVCHMLKRENTQVTAGQVAVFDFPKSGVDMTDKTAVMHAFHNACASCHDKTAAEGKKSGPKIGQCGECHVREPERARSSWDKHRIFNYAIHAKHTKAMEKRTIPLEKIPGAQVEIVGETKNKECAICHHTYDEQKKKLIYKKNTENACTACHKDKDEGNARSVQKVAHAACLGCHLTLAEQSTSDTQKFGPLRCEGCHGEMKDLTQQQIAELPRLKRGQKDIMDLSLGEPKKASEADEETASDEAQPAETETDRAGHAESGAPSGEELYVIALDSTELGKMKAVPFNHKAHEPRVQFCDTCHHYSMEKCRNCHSLTGNNERGQNISYEDAFHRLSAKQACVGCHKAATQDKKCAGCHTSGTTAELSRSSCAVCHRGPSGGEPIEIKPLPLEHDKKKVPDKIAIKVVENEFKPAELPHLKIVNKLIKISNESSLARWFHSVEDKLLCTGCHHSSEFQKAATKVPNCIGCHNRKFDPKTLGRPGIVGAYHQQCIGCHEAMKQKPFALQCAKCHPEKKDRDVTDLIPKVADKLRKIQVSQGGSHAEHTP